VRINKQVLIGRGWPWPWRGQIVVRARLAHRVRVHACVRVCVCARSDKRPTTGSTGAGLATALSLLPHWAPIWSATAGQVQFLADPQTNSRNAQQPHPAPGPCMHLARSAARWWRCPCTHIAHTSAWPPPSRQIVTRLPSNLTQPMHAPSSHSSRTVALSLPAHSAHISLAPPPGVELGLICTAISPSPRPMHAPSSHSSRTVALSLPCSWARLSAYFGSYRGAPDALRALHSHRDEVHTRTLGRTGAPLMPCYRPCTATWTMRTHMKVGGQQQVGAGGHHGEGGEEWRVRWHHGEREAWRAAEPSSVGGGCRMRRAGKPILQPCSYGAHAAYAAAFKPAAHLAR